MTSEAAIAYVMKLASLASVLVAAPLAAAVANGSAGDAPPAIAAVVVASSTGMAATGFDGVVEATRQTVVSAQVPGAVVSLHVKAGDAVKRGQLLLQVDGRAAAQQARAATAQVEAARAARDIAAKEFERQKQLFQESFISQAALDRAEALQRSSHAQASAQLAAAEAARTESGLYTMKAPYGGVVSEVSVVQGDMAMPGRALLTVYDPAALRVIVAVPQTAVPIPGAMLRVELPGSAPVEPLRWQVLPAADPATHTVQLRLELPSGTAAVPGTFARVWLPAKGGDGERLSVPLKAVLRRSELTGVYVIGSDGRPQLRQVRLGPARGDVVEVLTGLSAGERVALDPQVAARVR
jgi:membrane fusion protein, multidrug efflux system